MLLQRGVRKGKIFLLREEINLFLGGTLLNMGMNMKLRMLNKRKVTKTNCYCAGVRTSDLPYPARLYLSALTRNRTNLCVGSEGVGSYLLQLVSVQLSRPRVVLLLGVCGDTVVLCKELDLRSINTQY